VCWQLEEIDEIAPYRAMTGGGRRKRHLIPARSHKQNRLQVRMKFQLSIFDLRQTVAVSIKSHNLNFRRTCVSHDQPPMPKVLRGAGRFQVWRCQARPCDSAST